MPFCPSMYVLGKFDRLFFARGYWWIPQIPSSYNPFNYRTKEISPIFDQILSPSMSEMSFRGWCFPNFPGVDAVQGFSVGDPENVYIFTMRMFTTTRCSCLVCDLTVWWWCSLTCGDTWSEREWQLGLDSFSPLFPRKDPGGNLPSSLPDCCHRDYGRHWWLHQDTELQRITDKICLLASAHFATRVILVTRC